MNLSNLVKLINIVFEKRKVMCSSANFQFIAGGGGGGGRGGRVIADENSFIKLTINET